MRREGLWKRIAALGLTASMLLTNISPGFAGETSVVPEELSGAGSYIDEVAEDYSVDIDAAEEDDAVVYDELLSDSLIEDSDILQASDDSDQMITITFDAGEGSNFQVYDDESEEWTFTGGSKREVEAYSGDEVYIPDVYAIEAEGKHLIGWKDAEGNSYECGTSSTFTESTTLTAVWEESIKITFDAGEGSNFWVYDEETGESSYTGGSKRVVEVYPEEWVSIPSQYDIEVEGKRLIHWMDEEGNSYDCGESRTFTESTTLTAVWEEPIKITFDGGEGSNYQEYNEETGEYEYIGGSEYLVTVYPDENQGVWTPEEDFFQVEGKVLIGWTDQYGNTYGLGDWVEVTEDMTLTAEWDEAVTFTLYPNGGYWDSEYEDDEPVIKLFSPNEREYVDIDDFPSPERDGWICIGWADENHEPVLFDEEDEEGDYPRIKVEQDMNLYALWAEAVTVTYDPTDGYWDKDEETIYNEEHWIKYSKGKEIGVYSYSRPEHDSKAFIGWKDEDGNLILPLDGTDEAGLPVTISADKDMTLYAVWGDAYKLTLKVNNGYWYKSDDYVDKEDRTLNVAKGSAIDFDNIEDDPGHDTKFFAGWATDAAGKNIVLSRNIRKYTPSGNVSLYAAWTDPITVTFIGNGGKTSWKEDLTGQPVERYTEKFAKGDTVELYGDEFERDGHLISGWKVGNTVYKGSYVSFTANANTTVTAQWANKVTVRWHLNGGEFKWMDPDEMEDPAIYVDEYAQGDELNFYTPEKDNYAFLGWSLKEGSDELYLERYREKNPTVQSNLDLYAVWTEAYTVTFNGNGGVYYDYDGEKSSVTQTIPQIQSIGQYGYPTFRYPVDDGLKAFSHWALDENDENPVGWSDPVTEDMEVYAIWVPGVMVTFDLNGGNSSGSLSFSQVIEKDIIIGDHFYYGTGITPPAGKTFVGWSLKRNDTSSKISMYKLTQNVTLYALWKASAVKPSVPTDKITISKAPSGVKAKAAKKGKATLTWKKFKQTKKTKAIWKKIKKIEVQYSTDKNFKTGVISKTLSKKKTKLTVKKLKAKTTYYFRVRYVEGPYKVSKWSSAKKVKAKK